MGRALQSFEAHPGLPSEPSGRRRPVVALVHGATGRRTVTGTATFDVVAVVVDRRIVDRVLAIRPDAVLVDLDSGTIDAVRLCRVLRDALEARIVVVATDPLDDAVVVDVLDAGADDVVIGASPAVIDARVRVALRAQPRAAALPSVLEVGDVVVDLLAHEVRIDGSAVRCPPVQYELLVALARRPGVAIDGNDLLRTVWGAAPGDVHPRRLRIAVSVLRGILGIGPRRPRVETVARVGYRLVAPA
jgi:two-component system response regulator MtrA